ncbi:MAG: Tol-Pal system subunit TolQ [Desulfuromonas sp.]|uniref:MotA/TolQ/ExbB proton channel family protein n=1 Tax=Desulfuromonas sp. TaxID=892 RepID=UPI000CB80D03|nr:MotA/TolQ/ExbB proton channel family protein [Desulfuromonas sp.]PLX84044.1 MAG: Tol-Pal system subunit TolQ [Desulfuromonas sp.]
MDLVLNAGPVVKLVLLILVYFSVVSWAIIFFKFRVIHRATKDSERFLDFFWSKKRFDLIGQGLKDYDHSPLTTLFREAYQELIKGQRQRREPPEGSFGSDADAGDITRTLRQAAVKKSEFTTDLGGVENAKRALRRATTQETQRLEKFLTFLATTGSTAPFIGLFGTVWGIMDSFRGIGQSGSASLAVVAPGISEALVATAIGLVAAIPAVVGYNHFVNKVNILTGEMDNFCQEFLNIAERMVRGD